MNTLGTSPDALSDHPAPDKVRAHLKALCRYWHPVARTEALRAGHLLGVKLLGQELVLARLDGTLTALHGYCRHFQARLALGDVACIAGREHIRCPYHGWSYGQDGQCEHIPQLPPDKRIPAGARVARYLAHEAHGLIWICLADEPAAPLPAFPEAADTTFRTVPLDEPRATAASALRMIIGTLDDTHFPWVHEGILGTRDAPSPPEHRIWREHDTLRCEYQITQPANQTSSDASVNDAAQSIDLTYNNTVYMPTSMRLVKDSPAGRYVIWLACCPVDAFSTVNFWAFSRNYDLDPERDRDYAAFSQTVRDQDKPIVESQWPALVPPLSAGLTLAMAPADAPVIEYLRWIEELGITVSP